MDDKHDTNLLVPADRAAGKWISRELSRDPSTITNLVPGRFDSYVRLLHPATRPDGTSIRWSEVAEITGGTMHALAQWHVLVGSTDSETFQGSKWSGWPPDRGNLASEVLVPLVGLLAKHTAAPEHCIFGLWTGYTWRRFGARRRRDQAITWVGGTHSVEDLRGPRVALPRFAGRKYVLFAGPLWAAGEIGDGPKVVRLSPNSPNLIWPLDRAWFLTSDVDFDSTIIGGSRELIHTLLEGKEWEAFEVGPHDSLAADADSLA